MPVLCAPLRGRLEARGPDAAPGVAGGALFQLIGPVGDGVTARHHGGTEVVAADRARRDRAAVAVLFARAAGDRAVGDERAQDAGRVDPAGPRPAAAEAVLPIFRRVDAVEAYFHPGDHEAVAIDDARLAGDVGALPLDEPAGGGQPGERDCDQGKYARVARDPRIKGIRAVPVAR